MDELRLSDKDCSQLVYDLKRCLITGQALNFHESIAEKYDISYRRYSGNSRVEEIENVVDLLHQMKVPVEKLVLYMLKSGKFSIHNDFFENHKEIMQQREAKHKKIQRFAQKISGNASKLRIFVDSIGPKSRIGIPEISIDSRVVKERQLIMSGLETSYKICSHLLELSRIASTFATVDYIYELHDEWKLSESHSLILIKAWIEFIAGLVDLKDVKENDGFCRWFNFETKYVINDIEADKIVHGDFFRWFRRVKDLFQGASFVCVVEQNIEISRSLDEEEPNTINHVRLYNRLRRASYILYVFFQEGLVSMNK